MGLNHDAELLIVDEKFGGIYNHVFSHGSMMFNKTKGWQDVSSDTQDFFEDTAPNLCIATIACENATVASLLMPVIADISPRAALISYAQGCRWGITPTGKEGVLFADGTPSYVRGTDLAMELKREIPGIYIHMVSDLVHLEGTGIPAPDWDIFVRQGMIDSYSSRTIHGAPSGNRILANTADGRLAVMNLTPMRILVEQLVASKK